MIIYFVRHGESEANILKVFSSMVDEPYNLTDNGIGQIKEAALKLKDKKVNTIYSSPFPRTMQSSKIIIDNIDAVPELVIEDKIKEIDYGRYSGKKNDDHLDEVRKKQIAGDCDIRMGDSGENRREILTRIASFLLSIIDKHEDTDSIIVVSHGGIISITESMILMVKNLPNEKVYAHNGSIKVHNLSSKNRSSIQQVIDSLSSGKPVKI